MKNELRKALLDRRLSLGGWLQIGHPACAEIFARAGFDWVCVDLEHGATDLETMTNIFRTLSALACVPVARLPLNDKVWIRRSLDAGAGGLIIPMVNTPQEAEKAIAEAKYPPRGRRGFGYCRANMHGMNFADYMFTANDETALIMQIEHRDAIANLDAILETPDVDAVLIGPLDLSGSFGHPGDLESPEMRAALAKYRDACEHHKVAAGMHIVRPNEKSIHENIAQGHTLLALGMDNVFLDIGATEALRIARIHRSTSG